MYQIISLTLTVILTLTLSPLPPFPSLSLLMACWIAYLTLTPSLTPSHRLPHTRPEGEEEGVVGGDEDKKTTQGESPLILTIGFVCLTRSISYVL